MSATTDFAAQRAQIVARTKEVETALAGAESSLGAVALDKPASAASLANGIAALRAEQAALVAAGAELDRREEKAKEEAAAKAREKAAHAMGAALAQLAGLGPDLVASIDQLTTLLVTAETLEAEANTQAGAAGLAIGGWVVRRTVAQLVAASLGWKAVENVDRHALLPKHVEGFRAALVSKRPARPQPTSARNPWGIMGAGLKAQTAERK